MKSSETAEKDNQSLRAFLGHRRVGALELVGFQHMQGLNWQPQCLCRCLSLSQFFLVPTRTAMVKHRHARNLGNVSLRSCSRFALKSGSMLVKPVTFPPGRARPATRPTDEIARVTDEDRNCTGCLLSSNGCLRAESPDDIRTKIDESAAKIP